MRSQFPRLAAVIREESGAVGEYVIETLALHGRCTFPTLQEAVEQACQADRSDSVNSHHEVPSKQEIQEVVHALISSGLLVAANTCDLFTCLPDCAAALLNDKEGQDEPSSKVTGVKRKRPTAAEDMSNRAQARASRSRIIPSVADCANPDSVWRLDFACARQVLRRDAFTRLIASRYSGKEAKVLGAAMRLSERRQGYHNAVRTGPIAVTDLVAELGKVKAGIDRTECIVTMDKCSDDNIAFVKRAVGEREISWVISYEALLEHLKAVTVESVIETRYGVIGARIFRLLRTRPMLEQKHIADLVMVPEKETRRHLYSLVHGEMVRIHDIPRTPDHAPSRTFYLFHVDNEAAMNKVGADLNKIARNLKIRMHHEMEANRSLVASAAQNSAKTTQVAQLWQKADRLEKALFRVDAQSAILRERLEG
eukprot:TRINITY_DN3502_c0_g1_i6.p1 TRINITY_DN3502_c0_g1~~TRINITY_DN3502_c0_g1_i6.p1  ORF type:complete len:425 (-),score=60.02 TRINITY_DN3502_c0_g1_i6:143-1417(-)